MSEERASIDRLAQIKRYWSDSDHNIMINGPRVVVSDAKSDISFLVSEFEDEKAAHNEHMAELLAARQREQELIEWAKQALIGARYESCAHESVDLTWHCCDWREVVERANEIGVKIDGDW